MSSSRHVCVVASNLRIVLENLQVVARDARVIVKFDVSCTVTYVFVYSFQVVCRMGIQQDEHRNTRRNKTNWMGALM